VRPEGRGAMKKGPKKDLLPQRKDREVSLKVAGLNREKKIERKPPGPT